LWKTTPSTGADGTKQDDDLPAETLRSAERSCHDGVVVEWAGKPRMIIDDAEGRRKNAPRIGVMAA
jgi:hypothetical protein